MDIRNITDEHWHRDSKPYIYTQGYNWFILHYTSNEKALQNKPRGYSCNLYTTVSQIPFKGYF